jgi:hypothetical protein
MPYQQLIGEILQAAKLRTGVGQVGVDQTQAKRRRRIPA